MAHSPPAEKKARLLTAKQQRFVDLYLISLNATQAYKDAFGVSQKSAEASGPRLLGDVRVSKAIAEAQAKRSQRTQITADAVLKRLWTVATADPRELIEYRRTCCRHCFGKDFLRQRTKAELARDRKAWESTQKKTSPEVFDEEGGEGYNGTKGPNPECPECFGEGVERVFVHDTRRLSESAKCLYAGVKTTKDGLEIKMHAQQDALIAVGKHLGMFIEKPPEAPDAATIASQVREALRAMLHADGLA